MRRSVIALAALALAFGAAGCSLLRRPKPPKPLPAPLFEARTATLAITNGISLLAAIALPPGFAPAVGYPPMWLQHGMEIGVAGEVEGKTVVLGFSGAKLANRRVLAQDFGAAAATPKSCASTRRLASFAPLKASTTVFPSTSPATPISMPC